MADYETARFKMVENQLRANKVVDDRLLEAMRAVPRERFVPSALRSIAYADEDLRLAEGRVLMEPMLFGRLVQLAEVGPDDLALTVGAGMGYGAAVLSRMASAVVALEADEELAEAARTTIAADDVRGDNVVVEVGALQNGWPQQAPYDAIVIEGGGIEVRPDILLDQLGDGGRLVAMQANDKGVQRGVIYTKRGDVVSMRAAFDGATPTLASFERAPAFTF